MRDENLEKPDEFLIPSKDDKENRKRALLKRLKRYALRVIRLYESLPKHGAVHVISHQLLRSATSPGAQYAESCRAKSSADFISKIEGALQELEESLYWLELLIEGGFVAEGKLRPLYRNRRIDFHLRHDRSQHKIQQ